ncbi:MarR family winged helix-turn-helix transcriptional regulator [Nocardia sp. NPDC024068]|uniref:MarR family winged helix-turn-helix transcriptional regulator n=1 Tax=Nocardia sp. NPDC024068 TaxID=3157197 RepID=UPI0033C40B54
MSGSSTPTDGGPALFRLVRFWSRRWIQRGAQDRQPDLRHAQHVQVVEAVAGAADSPGEATITAVAHQLGLDHSGASRMVRDATAAGYLSRHGSDLDRRRTALHLTPAGHRLLADAHDWQRRVFDRLTENWPAADRRRFAGYLQRLADDLPHHD